MAPADVTAGTPPEEEVIPTGTGRVHVRAATFVMGAPDDRGLPPATLPEMAFLGRSNVGKSSLLNFITGKKSLARVSNTPGRTRELNVFRVELERHKLLRPIHLVDLPGYGYAELPQTQRQALSRSIDGYLRADRGRRVACLLLDIRRDPSKEDLAMAGILREAGLPCILALTKSDKLAKNQRKPKAAAIARALEVLPQYMILCSVPESQGRQDLWDRVFEGMDLANA